METKHTEGPWKLYDSDPKDLLIRAGEKGFVIAEVTSGITHFIGNQSEAEANAQLIAAAPDLLSVLIEAVEHAHVYDTPKVLVELFQVAIKTAVKQ